MSPSYEDEHVPISTLWEFSKEFQLDMLADEDRRHLGICEDCVAIIALCKSLSSVTDVEERLKQF
jgi:hypothetical protein